MTTKKGGMQTGKPDEVQKVVVPSALFCFTFKGLQRKEVVPFLAKH